MTQPSRSRIHFEDTVRTGVSFIDDILGEGLPAPSSILLSSQTVSEKRLLAHLFTVKGLQEGEKCIYIDFYRSPQLARRDFQRCRNIDLSRLTVIDAVSSQLLLPTEEKYIIRNTNDLKEIELVISKAIDENLPRRVVLDSLEFLADRFPDKDVIEFVQKIADLTRHHNSVLMLLFFNLLYDATKVSKLRMSVDYLLEFKRDDVKGLSKNFIKLHTTPGREDSGETEWIPFRFDDVVKDLCYVPRVLVTGPKGSGKTAIIELLNPRQLELGVQGRFGDIGSKRIEVSHIETEVFGEPTDERFEAMTRLFAKELDGILFVIDVTDAEKMKVAAHILEVVGKEIPTVLLANGSDQSGSFTPEKIRDLMHLPRNVDVMPIVAETGEGVWEAMWLLLMRIFGEKVLWV
ncbi:MAG: ATPase domain-containing protein [Thermoplasmata archaeon]